MFLLEKGVSPNVVTVRMDAKKRSEYWFLLRGDCHWDNPKSCRDVEEKHLKEALDCDAGIIDVGDLFCCMQSKWDPRSCKKDVRPEHQSGDYLDALVRTATDFYEPYAKNFVALGMGNHECTVLNRHETNLTERLAQSLRDRTGAAVPVTGYTGWVRFLMDYHGQRTTRTLWHCHGYGGGGPVTKDTIQAQRQHAYIDGADIMVSGHVHERWLMEHVKVGVDQFGEVKHRPIWYVKTGTLKEEYGSGTSGWHVGTGKPPKPIGGWWLKLTFDKKQVKGDRNVGMLIEITPTT